MTWYQQNKRKLPWRETSDPYAILVSEIMLQQTQVKTVIPYFHAFLDQYPSAQALAEAPEPDLLKRWQGLGYYRRARNLQKAATQIVNRHGGVFPTAKADIDDLAGVGAYTSAAVASIAFGQNWACVDGNVIRVVTRLLAMDQDTALTKTRKIIQEEAQKLICEQEPGDFNQAMMELGATVCTPRSPGCMTCPVRNHCATAQRGDDPTTRPVKSKRAKASKMAFESMFLFSGNRFLLARRPDKGLMAGMWELPAQEQTQYKPWPELLAGETAAIGALPKPVLHKFTHLHAAYHVKIYRADEQVAWRIKPDAYAETAWVEADDLKRLPLTKVLNTLIPQLIHISKGAPPCPNETSRLPGMQPIS